jgi:hypothetical protein
MNFWRSWPLISSSMSFARLWHLTSLRVSRLHWLRLWLPRRSLRLGLGHGTIGVSR